MKKKEKDTKVELNETKMDMMRPDQPEFRSPLTMMRHIAKDMEDLMSDIWFDRAWPRTAMFKRFFPEMALFDRELFRPDLMTEFTPPVEIFERGGRLIVHADLPGMKKEDIKIEVHDHRLMIEGERKQEFKEEKEGWYRSERSYGSFRRILPLPEGVKTEDAKAVFKNGVLEISMAAPKLALKARKLEITEEPKAAKAIAASG